MSSAEQVAENLALFCNSYIKQATGAYPTDPEFSLRDNGNGAFIASWLVPGVPQPTMQQLRAISLATVRADWKADRAASLAQTDDHRAIFAALELLRQKNPLTILNPVTQAEYEEMLASLM